jgi:beta-glucosidase
MVKGYFYWSLLDNYEWSYGFTERFGLVEVNYDTFTRTVRPSALIYKRIIEENTL